MPNKWGRKLGYFTVSRAIFTVNKVLLPKELFEKSPSLAPALGPVMSLSPAPVLAPSPVSEAPSPVKDMLSAPSLMETPST